MCFQSECIFFVFIDLLLCFCYVPVCLILIASSFVKLSWYTFHTFGVLLCNKTTERKNDGNLWYLIQLTTYFPESHNRRQDCSFTAQGIATSGPFLQMLSSSADRWLVGRITHLGHLILRLTNCLSIVSYCSKNFRISFQCFLYSQQTITITIVILLKATNGGPQWYSDNMMQTLIYLGTSWYFNTKHYLPFVK